MVAGWVWPAMYMTPERLSVTCPRWVSREWREVCEIDLENTLKTPVPHFVLVATGHAHPYTMDDLSKGGRKHDPSNPYHIASAGREGVPGMIYDAMGLRPYGNEFRRRIDDGPLFPTIVEVKNEPATVDSAGFGRGE